MKFQVSSHGISPVEILPTNRALVEFLPPVNLLMFLQPGSQSKALPALGALVQSHLAVAGPKMFQQGVSHEKALSAFRAGEGFLATVNMLMFQKPIFPTKSLPAHWRQLYGFSSVWTLWCLKKWHSYWKIFPHGIISLTLQLSTNWIASSCCSSWVEVMPSSGRTGPFWKRRKRTEKKIMFFVLLEEFIALPEFFPSFPFDGTMISKSD